MTPTVRLYPFDTRSGPANLAADEVLLDDAAAGVASLRFYLWDRPTLSLGYFQPAADRLRDPRLADLPWVRRASGGAAIVHGDGDLTYCLTLPPGKPWQGGESWLCRFHHLLAAVLGGLGAPVTTVVCGRERKLGPVLCFLHQTPADLLAAGSKVVGSAQRKLRGALMQHGTVRLRTSRFAPELPGLFELTGAAVSAGDLAGAAARAFAAETGWAVVPAAWTPADDRRAADLAAGKYATAGWNEKR